MMPVKTEQACQLMRSHGFTEREVRAYRQMIQDKFVDLRAWLKYSDLDSRTKRVGLAGIDHFIRFRDRLIDLGLYSIDDYWGYVLHNPDHLPASVLRCKPAKKVVKPVFRQLDLAVA